MRKLDKLTTERRVRILESADSNDTLTYDGLRAMGFMDKDISNDIYRMNKWGVLTKVARGTYKFGEKAEDYIARVAPLFRQTTKKNSECRARSKHRMGGNFGTPSPVQLDLYQTGKLEASIEETVENSDEVFEKVLKRPVRHVAPKQEVNRNVELSKEVHVKLRHLSAFTGAPIERLVDCMIKRRIAEITKNF